MFHSWLIPNGTIEEAVQSSAMRAPDALNVLIHIQGPAEDRFLVDTVNNARTLLGEDLSSSSPWVGGFATSDDWVSVPIKKILDGLNLLMTTVAALS